MSGTFTRTRDPKTIRNERRRNLREQLLNHDFTATRYRRTTDAAVNGHFKGYNERKRKNAEVRRSFTRAEWNAMHQAEVKRGLAVARGK